MQITRALRNKKPSAVCVLKCPKVFQCDNESEFKSNATKLLEKQNVNVQRATIE